MENHDLNQRRKGDVRSCAPPSFLLLYAPSGIYYAFAFLRRITHFSAYKQLVNSYRLREKLQKNFSGKNSFINRLYEDKYIYRKGRGDKRVEGYVRDVNTDRNNRCARRCTERKEG